MVGLPQQVAELPASPGVYRFRDRRGVVLYVGRAASLRSRVASYWGELRERRHLRRMVATVSGVEAVPCDSEHEAAWLERNLLERHLPRGNRSRGGQEVPTYLLLDDQRARPRPIATNLADRSEPGRWFGPYLGGSRARTAVAALQRVLPIGLTGERLGSVDGELARARGVAPAAREAMIARLVAVLEREPGAVARILDALRVRRDEASAVLAFETAAQLHDEIQALAWLLAEQKVTRPGMADAEFGGWHQGVLVRFEIRDGRLCDWTQQRSDRAAASPLLAATSPDWQVFAQRAAVLAERLSR